MVLHNFTGRECFQGCSCQPRTLRTCVGTQIRAWQSPQVVHGHQNVARKSGPSQLMSLQSASEAIRSISLDGKVKQAKRKAYEKSHTAHLLIQVLAGAIQSQPRTLLDSRDLTPSLYGGLRMACLAIAAIAARQGFLRTCFVQQPR